MTGNLAVQRLALRFKLGDTPGGIARKQWTHSFRLRDPAHQLIRFHVDQHHGMILERMTR